MKAIVVTDQAAGTAGMKLVQRPEPRGDGANYGDVVVQVHASGFTDARPADGLTIDFVVVPDRTQLSELVQRVRNGRLRTNIGNEVALDDAVAAFNSTKRITGKTIIRIRP